MIHSNPRPTALSLLDSGCCSIEDLWRRYRNRGGNADVLELDAYIHGVPLLHGLEVEILEATLNELPPAGLMTGRPKAPGPRIIRHIAIAIARFSGTKNGLRKSRFHR